MTGKLHNGLIEMLVVVGTDESTGLVAKDKQRAVKKAEHGLFSTPFEMEILAAISENVALFPSTPGCLDNTYPPGQPKQTATYSTRTWPRPKGESLTSESPKMSNGTLGRDDGRAAEPGTTRMMSHRAMSTYRAVDYLQHSFQPTEFPIGADTLNSLVSLCYPDSAITVQCEEVRDSVHYLCLTSVTGDRSYATCITHYRKYYTTRSKREGLWRLYDSEGRCKKGSSPQLCYVPCCYVTISKFPYFSLLKDVLSRLVIRIDAADDNWIHVLKETTLHLCMVPVPPPGSLNVEFELCSTRFTVVAPVSPGRPVVDWSLGVLLQCFSGEVVLDIMTCLLTQQRLVFVSSSYSLLPLITESFLQLLLPFQWHFTYVPMTPESLLELMDAPGTYIMGCHAKHKSFIQQMEEGPFLVDLDRGKLEIPNGCEAIPAMPSEPAAMFADSYKHLQHQQHTEGLDWRREFTYEGTKEQELKQRQLLNSAVTLTFLQLMANLFRHILVYIKPERNFFHKDVFLAGLEENEELFYRQVLDTDMFNQFLRARLAKEKDYWTDLVELTRPQLRNSLASGLDASDSRLAMRKTSSVSALSSIGSRPVSSTSSSNLPVFHVPNFVYGLSPKFLDNSASHLSLELKSCDTVSGRASLLYMRGMTLAALGHVVKGLEDFHTLASCDVRLLPSRYIGELYARLTEEERKLLQESVFYPNSPIIHARDHALKYARLQSVNMDMNKLPQSDIGEVEFVDLLKMLEIASDHDAITRLFCAFLGEAALVDAGTFEEFYKCWKENEVEVQRVHLVPLLAHHLDPNEALLVLSTMIKCSYGMGRIGLTHKRVFYLQEGSNKFRNVIRLRDIKSVDVIQQRSFLSVLPALKIHSKEEKSKSFVASLKGSSETWLWMVSEMWAGKMVSEEMMDPAIIQLAAQNVLLLHAFINSGNSELTQHHGCVEERASSLCYYYLRWKKGATSLPPETKDVLQHRVDPSAQQPTRSTVEALLYTPGCKSGDADDANSGPQLWCGLASGRIEVYDASSWLLSTHHIQAGDRVVCLCAVGENQVWAGSFDKVIYVIEMHTHSCYQALREHTDIVTDLSPTPDHSFVFSSSINGQILKWDTGTGQKCKTLDLPDQMAVRNLLYHDEHLWCATRTDLCQVSCEDGHLMRRLAIQTEDRGLVEYLQLDCFLFTPTNELWIGTGRQGEIVVYHPDTWEVKRSLKVGCRGIGKMEQIGDKIWVGSKEGKLYIFDSYSYEQEKVLQAHEDAIRAMCSAQQRYVITGAGSQDGRVAIWRASSTAVPR